MQLCWRRFGKATTFTRALHALYSGPEQTKNSKKHGDLRRLSTLLLLTRLNHGVCLNASASPGKKQKKSLKITTTLTRVFAVTWMKFPFELVNMDMCVQSRGVSARYLASRIEMPTFDELPSAKR